MTEIAHAQAAFVASGSDLEHILKNVYEFLGNALDKMKDDIKDRNPPNFTNEEVEQRKQIRAARKSVNRARREIIFEEMITIDTSAEIKSWIEKMKDINDQVEDKLEEIDDFVETAQKTAEVTQKVVAVVEKAAKLAAKLRPTP